MIGEGARPAEPGVAAGRRGRSGPRRVDSGDLFGGGREVVILHNGQEYRLHLTRSDKLILTK